MTDFFTLANVIDNGHRNNDLGGRPQIDLQDFIEDNGGVMGYQGIARAEVPMGGLANDVIDPVGTCTGSSIDPQIRVLSGRLAAGDSGVGNTNNHSLVIRVDFGEFSMMFSPLVASPPSKAQLGSV